MKQSAFPTTHPNDNGSSTEAVPAPDTIEARGPVVAGYAIGEETGQGPLGKIYRATHEQTGQQVVFRGFTRPEGADAQQWQKAEEQFRDLLEKHRAVEKHPNIQKIVDFGDDDGLFWIATEYFEGKTLRSILDSEGAQSLRWAISVLRQVAHAADWASERGLAHTDLTPYNILVINQPEAESRKIQVKVINFGLAHARKKYGSRYAAPEQIAGKEGDRRADVYAVGTLFYEALTGVHLHDGETPEAIAAQTRANRLPSPLLPDQPDFVGKVLSVMLASDPLLRYASISEAVDDFDHERAPESLASTGIFDRAVPENGVSGSNAISLQDYRLSDQDVVVIQRQRYAIRQDPAEEEAERRGKRVRLLVTAGIAAAMIGLGFHASTLPGTYRQLRVAAIVGAPMSKQKGISSPPSSLRVGDVITDEGAPRITTGPNDSVVLTAHNARIVIEPNSTLTVTKLDYTSGGIRRFELQKGTALASVTGGRRSAILEIDAVTPSGMGRTQIKSGAYAVNVAPGNHAIVSVLSGKAIAAINDASVTLSAGNGATISGGVSPGDTISEPLKAALNASLQKANAAPGTPSAIAAMMNAEERWVLPLVTGVGALTNLPGYLNDRKARITALAGMQSLCILTNQNPGEDAPAKVNLSTLEPLSIGTKDRQRILSCFESGKILSYRRLPEGGYEFVARADDAEKTLILGRNGKARLAANDDLEDNSFNLIGILSENASKASGL